MSEEMSDSDSSYEAKRKRPAHGHARSMGRSTRVEGGEKCKREDWSDDDMGYDDRHVEGGGKRKREDWSDDDMGYDDRDVEGRGKRKREDWADDDMGYDDRHVEGGEKRKREDWSDDDMGYDDRHVKGGGKEKTEDWSDDDMGYDDGHVEGGKRKREDWSDDDVDNDHELHASQRDWNLDESSSDDEEEEIMHDDPALVLRVPRRAARQSPWMRPARRRGWSRAREKVRKRWMRGDARDDPNLEWRKWQDNLGPWRPWGNEYLDLDANLENMARNLDPAAMVAPSAKLVMPLLPYQKEWLGWSLRQEDSEYRGGILADEMGMGKTIQAISLIVSSPVPSVCEPMDVDSGPSTAGSSSSCHKEASGGRQLPQVKATLVVCPVVAVNHWKNEIERVTDGSVKVMVYHGAKRGGNLEMLSEYDVVLTTFKLVESEYRKNIMPPKVACTSCGRKMTPQKMVIHIRRVCRFQTEKQAKQCTKQRGGTFEEAEHAQKTTAKGKTQGATKRKGKVTKKHLAESLDGAQAKDTWISDSPLHSVKWARIILDEAHTTKDRNCNTAKAVYALDAFYRWALTGTLLQN